MKDTLGKLVREKRKVDKRVTNENKNSIINLMNKYSKDYGVPKLDKNSSVKDVERYKKSFKERISYDIVTLAIQEGNSIIAEIESRDLKKSDDKQTQRLGEFAKQLAEAKKQTSKGLTKEDKAFLERGNTNILGFGNMDIITLFEKTKNKKQVQALIKEIKEQNAKQVFYDNQIEVFQKVFRKVEVFREDDINKIKELILKSDMQGALDKRITLLQSVEMYCMKNLVGKADDETELANTRLDDMLIKFGINKQGSQKVKKVMSKYKKE